MSTNTSVGDNTPVEVDPIMNRRRRPSFTVHDLCRINGALFLAEQVVRNGELDDLIKRITAMVREECDPKHREIVDSYRAAVEVRDGEMEIDDDAEVSLGDDAGAYIMVWKWVSESEAGLEPQQIICNRCGDLTNEDESPDGEMCPDCYDQSQYENEE